jgi:hypothetical protein
MQGPVRRASRSPHASHVIQRIAEFMPLSCVVMVAEELSGMAVTIAKNQFGLWTPLFIAVEESVLDRTSRARAPKCSGAESL